MSPVNYKQPIFNYLPPVVIALAGTMAVLEVVFLLFDSGLFGGNRALRYTAIERFGFFDRIWDFMVSRGRFQFQNVMRLATFPFVHGGFFDAAFAVTMILGLGKAVGDVFRPWAFVVLFFASSAIGAVVYASIFEDAGLIIGGLQGAFGLIGAFTFLLWARLESLGGNSLRAFGFVSILLGIHIFAQISGFAGFLWVSELVAFVAGFGLSVVLRRGGWTQLLARLRQR